MARSLQDRLREVQERGRVEADEQESTPNVGPGFPLQTGLGRAESNRRAAQRRGDERTNFRVDKAGSGSGSGSGAGSGSGSGSAALTSLKARLQALIDQQTRRREREHDDVNVESDLQPPYEIDSADALDGPANYETWLAARNRSRGGGLLGRARGAPPPSPSRFNQPSVADDWNYGLEGPPEDLAKLIGAEIITTPHGEYMQRDAVFRLDARVGRATIEKLVRALPDAARILTASMNLVDFDPRKAAFIDTETTGLSGGAGTAAFLVAVGFIEGDSFIVRQYFMRDFHEERALIRAVETDLERFDTIVSFNGKQFDVPLLESRFRLQRRVFRQIDRHLDMLHPGRRLWKARLESCSLQSLERGVLGFHREDDIPGAFIPERYFEYLRKKDGRLMAPVMEHNLQDIVSLAVLTGEALAMVSEPGALPDDAFDILSLGKVLERAEMDERSEEVYRVIAETGVGRARTDATVRLAYRAKARKLHDEAERLWRAAVALASAVAHRELAMLLEHTRKNKVEALRIVDDGLDLVAGRSDFASLEDDLLKRRRRLTRVKKK